MSKKKYYPILMVKEDDGYFACIPDLDGCATQGEDAEETLERLYEAYELWKESAEDIGLAIPEPSDILDLKDVLRYKKALEEIVVAPGRHCKDIAKKALRIK